MEEIDTYLKRLIKEYPAIESIWLIGSRANCCAKADSDWDFFVFTDKNVLCSLINDKTFIHKNIDLLIVYDGENFIEPWKKEDRRDRKKGNLGKWKWKLISADKATYEGDKNKPVHPYDCEYEAVRYVIL